jgi:hypothetical protein
LQQVIRTYAETFGGSLKGAVIPPDAVAYVQSTNETDTLISLPETDGKFLFAGLHEGSYDLTVIADMLSEYAETTIVDIAAENAIVANPDTIRLIPPESIGLRKIVFSSFVVEVFRDMPLQFFLSLLRFSYPAEFNSSIAAKRNLKKNVIILSHKFVILRFTTNNSIHSSWIAKQSNRLSFTIR